jgi:hypothetical protein
MSNEDAFAFELDRLALDGKSLGQRTTAELIRLGEALEGLEITLWRILSDREFGRKLN